MLEVFFQVNQRDVLHPYSAVYHFLRFFEVLLLIFCTPYDMVCVMIALIVILIRLIVPLTILRYPLFGAILSILLDSLDWHTLMYIDPSLTEHYQAPDKILDIYYLSLEAYVVSKWNSFKLRTITLGFFMYRCLGVLLFEFTGNRLLLFLFPNVFEFLFLYILVHKKDFQTFPLYSHMRLASFVSFVVLLKLFQEYMMHVSSIPYWKIIEGK